MPPAQRGRWWTLLVILAAVVAWLGLIVSTHMPATQVEAITGDLSDSHIDKLLHAAAYGLVTWLTIAAGAAQGRWSVWGIAGLLAVVAAIAALDELTQPWFGRYCDINDWLADLLGATLAAALGWWMFGRPLRRLRERPS